MQGSLRPRRTTTIGARDVHVEDLAPGLGLTGIQARLGRQALGLEHSGVSLLTLPPGYRVPFGHRHGEQEEVYVVLSGTVRMKIEDEIIDMAALDAVRVHGSAARAAEGGPEGAQILAIGAPIPQESDAEVLPDWWKD
jgi:uncharacterized cupin superfamily protein